MLGIISKIFNAQIIFEHQGKTIVIDSKKSLWQEKNNTDFNRYRAYLKKKIKQLHGEHAVEAFAQLAEGHQNSAGIEYVFMTPMIEHYFNYLIFVKEAFKQAIMDLYLFKREFINKIEIADRAIIYTAWVAKQRGAYLIKDAVDLEFADRMDQEFDLYTSKFLKKNHSICEACVNEFFEPVKKYYYLPNQENFLNIILQADKLSRKYLDKDWMKLLGLVHNFNYNLGESLIHSADKVLNYKPKLKIKVAQ
jgi:hypothetical protein